MLHWSERISHPGYYAVVAKLDGHIVGSHFLDERDPIAGVGSLTVDPAVQDNRIGLRLMEAVLPGQLRNGTAELTDVKQANSPQLNGRVLLSIGRN